MSISKTPPSTVVVEETTTPVRTMDPNTFQPIHLGDVTSRVYLGEEVQRHSFETVGTENDPPKHYALGPTSTRWEVVDHYQVLEPLIDQGLKIKRGSLSRGGLDGLFEMVPNNEILHNDPIMWDRDFWAQRNRPPDSHLSETMVVKTSARPGKGISVSSGYFRLICTNGLIGRVLDLGTSRFTHANFSDQAVRNAFQAISGAELRGPYIGNAEGVRRLRSFLEGTLNGLRQARRNPSENAPQVPLLVRETVTPLVRMPAWWLQGLIVQLALFGNSGLDEVYALDTLTMVTNPLTLEENSDRSFGRAMGRVPTVAKSVANLVSIYSM